MSSCPSIEELEHALGNPADGDVAAHASSCARCGARIARLRQNQELLKAFQGVGARQLAGAMHSGFQPGSARPEGLAGYEITGELFRGGQGVVYRALQKATKRTVAIKVVLQGAFATRRQRNRFEREIEIAARLRHPNIVTVHESGVTSDGSHYFVMEYVEGVALDAYWRNAEAASGRDADIAAKLRLFAKICDAVNAAHQRGVIHRDLKPANVLVDAAGEPRVLDFGLAKAVGASFEGGEDCTATRTGEFMGTFRYAAPEQVRGDPDLIDTRTDVYALGVMLYQTLTGKFPYAVDGSLSAVLRNITEAEPESPSAHATGIGDELSTIVLKALAKERERRYQSAAALRRDIESLLAGEPIDAKRDSRWYVLRKTARQYRLELGLGAVFVVLAAGFGTTMAFSARKTARERDRAQAAERSAERNAMQLAAALSESRIQQGTALAATGNVAAADEIFWREFLSGGADGLANPRQSRRRRAFWALWEMYASAPCRLTWRIGDSGRCQSSMDRDGRILMATDDDGPLDFWELASGRLISSHPDERAGPVGILMAPAGDLAVVLDGASTIHLWNLDKTTGKGLVRRNILAPDQNFMRIAISPDSRSLAAAFESKAIWIWDDLGRNEPRQLCKTADEVASLAFNERGRALAIGLRNGDVVLEDVAGSGGQRWTTRAHQSPVRCVSFSPDDSELATAGADSDCTVRMWEAESGRFIRSFPGHTSYVNSVAFSPDARRLASAGSDRTVRIWNARTGDLIATYGGHSAPVLNVRFTTNGERIATTSGDLTARLWDAAPSQMLHGLPDQKLTVMSVCATKDGGTVYSSGSDGTIHERDATTGDIRASFRGHAGPVSGVCVSPDGRRLASVSYDRTLREWDTATRALLHEYRGFDGNVMCAAYHPEGRLLATGSDDGVVRIWDTSNGTCVRAIDGPAEWKRRPTIAFSPDGRTIAAAEGRSAIALYNMEGGARRALLRGHLGQVRCVTYSPDGRLIASAGNDASVRLWDATTGEQRAMLEGHTDDVFGLAFSHDGTMLASGGRGKPLKLWDVESRQCLATLTGRASMVFAVLFSHDDERLFSCGADGMLGVWDLRYYDRHIAGNLEFQLTRFGDIQIDPRAMANLRAWAAETLTR